MIGNLASQFRPSGHKLTTSKGLKQLTINSKPPTLNLETSKQHSLFAELECLLSGPQATKQTKTLPTSILKHEPLGMQAKKVILAQHYFNTTEMQQYTQTKKKTTSQSEVLHPKPQPPTNILASLHSPGIVAGSSLRTVWGIVSDTLPQVHASV